MTIKEIASLAGVSTSTVSKIMNNKADNINIDTKNRVLKIVKEYNYTPYGSVINTSNTKSFLIGILSRSYTHAQDMLQGVLGTLQNKGYSLLVYDSEDDPQRELKNINLLCNQNVDGVIWEPVDTPAAEKIQYFSDRNLPLLYMNHPDETVGYRIDFFTMGYQAAQSLLDAGHRSIACLTKPGSERSEKVLQGFISCLFDHNIPYSEEQHLQADALDCYRNIIAPGFSGVVSSHYIAALTLYRKLGELQYRVPQDLSLVTVTQSRKNVYNYPEISCMEIPYHSFGHFLGEKMVQMCETEQEAADTFHSDYRIYPSTTLAAPAVARTRKILVVGSINIDITLNVEELPQSGKTARTAKSLVLTGGKGANQACGITKLGGRASLIGKVGNDYEASLVYNSMQENSIDTRGIQRDTSAETGKAYIHVQPDGESTISILAGANDQLSVSDIHEQAALFENTDFCLLQTEIPLDVVKAAAAAARQKGIKTILKPASMQKLDEDLMKDINIFIPNLKEAEFLCPGIAKMEDMAAYLLDKGPDTIIITLGHRGSYVRTRDYEGTFPAQPFTSVDNTGAADAFISALAVFLSEGYPLDKAVRIATYAAGFCISRQGVFPALIDRNSLETYIKAKEKDLL